MPRYAYRAVTPRGRMLRGRLEAGGEEDLARLLRSAGLHLVRARPIPDPTSPAPGLALAAGPTGPKRHPDHRRSQAVSRAHGTPRLLASVLTPRLPARDLQPVCLHLDQALGAGVPLMETLADLAESAPHRPLRRLLWTLRADVAAGLPLSRAFGRHADRLGPMVEPVIRAGEDSGNLAAAFRHLADHLAWRDGLDRRLAAALRYPLIVLAAVAGLFVFLMIALVPELAGFLTALGQGLPWQTRALIATSETVVRWGPLLVPGLAFVVVLLAAATRISPGLAYTRDAVLLGLPGVGHVIRRLALARFAHFFALMIRAGVPLDQCLRTGGAVLGNRVLHEALETAATAVTAGLPLSQALRLAGAFPPLVWRMVRVGEDSGDLVRALAHVEAVHTRDATDATERLGAVVEPALLGLAGTLLGWIVWAVLVPVYDGIATMPV